MYPVNYVRAASVEEAERIAADCDDPRYLAGGQTLIPTLKARLAAPSHLIDLARIPDLGAIEVSDRSVHIGAMATHAEIAAHRGIACACPTFALLAGRIGDPHVRHMGTIGGSVANNDPAADYSAALLALDATVVTNRREIAADAFFSGLFETALEENEIVTAVSFMAPAGAAYEKFRNPASHYALAGVFVAQGDRGVRVGITGAGDDGAFRPGEMEERLSARLDPAALDGIAIDPGGLMSDLHATAEYRSQLIGVLARRAVASLRR